MTNDPHLSEIWLAPMGLTLRVISNSPAILAATDASFGRFGRVANGTAADFTFELFQHARNDGPPAAPMFRRDGDWLTQTAGQDNTLEAYLPGGKALGYFSPTTLADAPYFRWHFLELAFYQMLEARGWMGVHASALVRDERTLLLRAASGGGKTTLAFAGARSGRFKALAEDVVWLSPDGARCWGIPWHFHLLPDAVALFPELTGQTPRLQTSGEMKLEVDLEQYWPGNTISQAQVGTLVFVTRTPGQSSRLASIAPAEAHRLWPLAQTGLEGKSPHHAAHIERLINGSTYQLYFGDDIDTALDLLSVDV